MDFLTKAQLHTAGQTMKFCRRAEGITQKELGLLLGFSADTADVRIAQYEAGIRKPKSDMTDKIARLLNVSKYAISAPSLNTETAASHTLMKMDSIYGLNIVKLGDEIFISFPLHCTNLRECTEHLYLLKQLLQNGEISYADYQFAKHRFQGAEDL